MVAARKWWPNKAAEQLAAVLDCDVRSAERYLAGDRTPSADAVLKLLCSDKALKLIEITVGEMPPDQAERFWAEMAKASKRRLLQTEMAKIQRKLDEAGE